MAERDIPSAKRVQESQAEMSELMMPHYASQRGTVHGGFILMLMDRLAYVCSAQHACTPCVTASIDRVDFLSPVDVGDLVIMRASVNMVGTTSMEVGIKVLAKNVLTQEARHTNSSYITMVALDKQGKPQRVPKLICETEDEKRRNREAKERRAWREEERNR